METKHCSMMKKMMMKMKMMMKIFMVHCQVIKYKFNSKIINVMAS